MSRLSQIMHNPSASPYWIAETAFNHEGDFTYLQELVKGLKNSGAHGVKFHIMLDVDSYIVKDQPLYPILQNWLLTKEQWHEIFELCRHLGLDIIGLVDEPSAIDFLLQEKIDAYAIHATSINDYHMLKKLSAIEKPLFIGIGGTTIPEIKYALQTLHPKKNIILMYGIQSYPTPLSSIHLQKIPLYRDEFGIPVGYADHTSSEDHLHRYLAYTTAYALQVRIFEQHITLDLSTKKEDDESAIEVDSFSELCKILQTVESMIGPREFFLKDHEKDYAKIRKKIVAASDLLPGTIIEDKHIAFKRTLTTSNIEAKDYVKIVGKKILHPVQKDEVIHWEHLEDV